MAVCIIFFEFDLSYDGPCGNSDNSRPVRNIVGNHSTGSDGRSISDSPILQYLSTGPDQCPTSNLHPSRNISPRVNDASFTDPGLMTQGAAKITQAECTHDDVYCTDDTSTYQCAFANPRSFEI